MRKFLLLVTASLFATLMCFSQSLLWKVSGNGLESPSYLYGTIHISDKRVFAFDSTVTKAMESCEVFASESKKSRVPILLAFRTVLMKERMEFLLSDSVYHLLDSIVTKSGQNIRMYSRIKPIFAEVILTSQGLWKGIILDHYLLQNAKAQKKKCYSLENERDALKLFNRISLEYQVEHFSDCILYLSSDSTYLKRHNQELIENYLQFRFDSVHEGSIIDSLFVIERNVVFADNVVKITNKRKSVFCAFGCGHLLGEEGVIAILRRRGYSVEPVPFQWNSVQ